MIIISDLLPEILKTFKILEKGNIIPFTTPFRISQTCKGLTAPKFVESENYTKQQYKWHVGILVLASFFGIYRYLYESHSVMGRTLAIWNDLSLLIHAFWGYYYVKESKNIAWFFNELINFETDYITGKIKSADIPKFKQAIGCKGACDLAKTMRTSISFVCIMLSASGALFPTAKWALLPRILFDKEIGQLFFEDSYIGRVLLDVVQRLISFIFTYMSWRSLCNIGIVCNVLNLAIATYCLSAMVDTFKWKVCEGKMSPLELCLMYRNIQYICKLYNNFHKKCVIMGFIIYMPACVSVCVYLVAGRWNDLDIMSLLMFSNYAQAASVTIMLVFQYAVKVYMLSDSIKYNLPKGCRNFGSVKRYWKSFQVVKVNFFSNNFFESTTPMVIMDFSVNQAINLVLGDSR